MRLEFVPTPAHFASFSGESLLGVLIPLLYTVRYRVRPAFAISILSSAGPIFQRRAPGRAGSMIWCRGRRKRPTQSSRRS